MPDTPLSIPDTLARTVQLLARHGGRMVLEFAGLALAIDWVFWTAFPDAMQMGEEADLAAYFTNPAVLGMSLVYIVAFGIALPLRALQIWQVENPGFGGPGAAAFLGRVSAPVIAIDGALLLWLTLAAASGAPGLMSGAALSIYGIYAVLTVLIPVLVVEGRGWASIPRATRLAMTAFPRVVLLLAIVGVGYMLSYAVLMGPVDELRSEDPLNLFAWPVDVVFSIAFDAVILALSLAIYEALSDAETGGPSRDLPDIFR